MALVGWEGDLPLSRSVTRAGSGVNTDEPGLRFRFFQKKDGRIFAWTTGRDKAAWFLSCVYVPATDALDDGPKKWCLDEKSVRRHRKRKDARRRALALYFKNLPSEQESSYTGNEEWFRD
jgi:hypothetical protein